MRATVTSKGQVTLPAALRARLGLAAGDRVRFEIAEDGTVVLSREARTWSDLGGILPRSTAPRLTPEAIDEAVSEALAQDDERIRREYRDRVQRRGQ